ncbi:MAG: DUF3343 domain-containing protein [Thermacetogeniaceae bacterium]
MAVNSGRSDVVAAAVVTFSSSHHAFKAEKIFREAGIPALLIPVPAEIRADCGVALLISPKMLKKAEEALKEAGLEPSGSYEIIRERRRAGLWQRVLGIE